MRRSLCLLVFIVLILEVLTIQVTPLRATPVQPVEPPIHHPISPWRSLNRHAALIFAGRVLHIHRSTSVNLRDVESVEISFIVEQAIRGVRRGQTLTIREWAGLWVVRPRYRVGERVVLFLYPPSRLGLTSPVNEITGRFAVSSAGRVRFSPAQRASFGSHDVHGQGTAQDLPLHEFLRQIRESVGGQL